MKTRTMSVAGSFYPNDPHEIQRFIAHFDAIGSEDLQSSAKIKAVIVPHAGWIYSGYTANLAFKMLNSQKPIRYILIGPSHRVGYEGISISDMDSYETPLGMMDIDREMIMDLQHRFGLECYMAAHHEHSTEVQMPFIHYYSPDAKVVELVYAYATPKLLVPIIKHLLTLPDTVVVISTDLSHFHTLEQANALDALCLEAIKSEDKRLLERGCEACGIIGVDAMLEVARDIGLKSRILDYRTSADASGDTTRVVGYMSAVFY